METPRDTQSEGFRAAAAAIRQMSASGAAPGLGGAGSRAPEAWFLGPRAENAATLERLIVEAIRDQVFWRRNFHPGDPSHITEEIKRTPAFLQASDALQEGFEQLLAFLKKSVPFFSMRYQGHMNWETTIPGIVGYFAAMLYNPNNVAFEGSTTTTLLELLVGDDLCRMLGYSIPSPEAVDAGAIRPWGHITCDGTVANIEALWAARNVACYSLALQAALRDAVQRDRQGLDAPLVVARDLTVPLSATQEQVALLELGLWETQNLSTDDVLALPRRLERQYGISPQVVAEALNPFSLQSLGMAEFARRFMAGSPAPVFFVPGTKHYSFPKAAALLGIGATNMIDVPVDIDARLDLDALRERLTACQQERRPVYSVVAVMGTTEESAIDPLEGVLSLRDECRRGGLNFTVHADAAWGGYHVSVIREDFDMPQPHAIADVAPPRMPLSLHASRHLGAMGGADSITVDPHKSGYIPYPAGALCYRNGSMRNLVTFSAPVVFHGEAEPTVGIYGIEGSKPGASAASVYLSHRVIRPSRSGYGQIIGQALFSCKKLYARLLCLARPQDPFVVVPLPRLPAEILGRDRQQIEAQVDFIRERIVGKTNADLLSDPEELELLSELGPDENILAYAFNLRTPDGDINSDLALANRLNRAIYDRLSIDPGQDIYGYDLIVSTTDLDAAQYGQRFIEHYKGRLGVGESIGTKVTVLRSVVMDPWVTETAQGSFLDTLEVEFRRAVSSAIDDISSRAKRGY